MKSFDEFDVENRKIVLIEEYPCQNRKQPEKKEGEYIMKMIRTVLANVLLVGLERNIAMPQESITFNNQKKKRILKNTKKNTNSVIRTINIRYKKRQNTIKIRINIMRRIQSIEQKTEKQ